MALSECPRWRATKLGSQQGWPSGPVCIGRTATVYRVCSGLLGFFGGAANDRDGRPAVRIIAADGDLPAGRVDAAWTGAFHVAAAGDPPQAERHGHPTQNAQADEYADDNQSNLERTSALRRGGSGGRGSCSRRRSARRASAHGGSAGSTEIVAFHQR